MFRFNCQAGKTRLFRVPNIAEILVQLILAGREKGVYLLPEFVVMPNHFYLFLTPAETTSLEKAVPLIKGGSSHEIHQQTGDKTEIRQIGFQHWTIRDGGDYRAKVGYIQMNPVQAPLVERPEDWPFGSACGKFAMDSIPEKFKS